MMRKTLLATVLTFTAMAAHADYKCSVTPRDADYKCSVTPRRVTM
ncbi:hypothetical protein LTSEINV_4619 [Salmonella enterica subsp. enterica serovar Inverness str. R8-3668]|uniref:Periplasmic protein n=1 Tax=Salmonella enterica subsp. enterica serovar Inverness str. R8-3668 TaxID=913075 RepID=G5NI02_SALET|nr:hypothetical protein LTSEINV_4619 [Salmonella enterica subsp. enterica serovar Inverness str. R8-3668]